MSWFARRKDKQRLELNFIDENDKRSKKYCADCKDWTIFIIKVGEPDEIVMECSKCGYIMKLKIIGNLTTPIGVYERYKKWKKGELANVSKAEEDCYREILDEEKKK